MSSSVAIDASVGKMSAIPVFCWWEYFKWMTPVFPVDGVIIILLADASVTSDSVVELSV